MLGMIGVGLVLTISGIILIFMAYNKTKTWILTGGEVYAHQKAKASYDSEGNYSEGGTYESIRYEVNGQEIRKQMSYSIGFPYRIGKVLPILYHPSDAYRISIQTFSRMYLLPLVLFLCGVFILYGSFQMH